MLPPCDQVVHLLHLDVPAPAQLPRELLTPLFPRAGPDLGGDHGALVPAVEGSPDRSSAPPYIGDESTSLVPAATAAPTTSRASRASAPNVFHVPSPTTGPNRRSSITKQLARELARRERGGEEPWILVRPRPMCDERQAAQASRQPDTSTATAAPIGSPIGQPAGQATSYDPLHSESTARVWCERPRWRSRGSRFRDA